MDPIRDELLADLAGLSSRAPDTTLLSTVTGEPVSQGQLGAEYWWDNIRSPVLFTEATAALVADGFRIFVEIGPNPVLQAYLHDALRATEGQGRILASLSRKQGDEDPFPAIAAQCHVAGHDITGARQTGNLISGPTPDEYISGSESGGRRWSRGRHNSHQRLDVSIHLIVGREPNSRAAGRT